MRFVVQKHQSSHFHYDFRIELDGVAKSWAIPKEPPIDSDIKRLAVEVDDHEIGYMDFEGTITEGYGKGTVEIWDKGEYDLIDIKPQKLIIVLHGKKLNGEYVILRFNKAGEKNWLFFKKPVKDKYFRTV